MSSIGRVALSSKMRSGAALITTGALVAACLIAALLSASQAPRFFGTPGPNSWPAAEALRVAVMNTEHSQSFTAVTYQHGQSPQSVVYQAPNKASIELLPHFPVVSVGQYTFYRDNCTKTRWERESTPTRYGPADVMYDLDLILSSQRIVKIGSRYLAQYVPSFPWVKVNIVVQLERGRVFSERESFDYGKGTGWILRPFSNQNFAYTVRYTKIDTSPSITVPRPADTEDLSGNEAVHGCGSFVVVGTRIPTDS
jgi:hypothetical protein